MLGLRNQIRVKLCVVRSLEGIQLLLCCNNANSSLSLGVRKEVKVDRLAQCRLERKARRAPVARITLQ